MAAGAWLSHGNTVAIPLLLQSYDDAIAVLWYGPWQHSPLKKNIASARLRPKLFH
jgi:hypothetical protein